MIRPRILIALLLAPLFIGCGNAEKKDSSQNQLTDVAGLRIDFPTSSDPHLIRLSALPKGTYLIESLAWHDLTTKKDVTVETGWVLNAAQPGTLGDVKNARYGISWDQNKQVKISMSSTAQFSQAIISTGDQIYFHDRYKLASLTTNESHTATLTQATADDQKLFTALALVLDQPKLMAEVEAGSEVASTLVGEVFTIYLRSNSDGVYTEKAVYRKTTEPLTPSEDDAVLSKIKAL